MSAKEQIIRQNQHVATIEAIREVVKVIKGKCTVPDMFWHRMYGIEVILNRNLRTR